MSTATTPAPETPAAENNQQQTSDELKQRYARHEEWLAEHTKSCGECQLSQVSMLVTGRVQSPPCQEALAAMGKAVFGDDYDYNEEPQHVPEDAHVHKFSWEGKHYLHVSRGDGQALYQFVEDEELAKGIINAVNKKQRERMELLLTAKRSLTDDLLRAKADKVIEKESTARYSPAPGQSIGEAIEEMLKR